MKKVIIAIASLVLCFNVTAQEYFTGDKCTKMDVKLEVDVQNVIKTAQQNVDKLTKDPLVAAMAKSMIKTKVTKMFKQQELLRYTTTFPNGEFTSIAKLDTKNNRQIVFCPELGRFSIADGNKGLLFVVFPKLQLAYMEEKAEYCNQEALRLYTKMKLADVEPEMIDGELCVPYYDYKPYDQVGGIMMDTITINGILYVKGESFGWAYADYPFLPYQIDLINEYGEQIITSLTMVEKEIDEANFEIPTGYKVGNDLAKFAKQVSAALKKQDASIPFDGNIPDNLWSLVP